MENGTKIGGMVRVNGGWKVASIYPFTTFTQEEIDVLEHGDALFHGRSNVPDATVYRCANCNKIIFKMGMLRVLVPVFCGNDCENKYNGSIDTDDTEVDHDYDLLKFSFDRLKTNQSIQDWEYALKNLKEYCRKYGLDYRGYIDKMLNKIENTEVE